MKSINQLIIDWLKKEFEVNQLDLQTKQDENLWVMAASAVPLECPDESPISNTHPTHKVRVVLRNSYSDGTCDYVDGTDIKMLIDEISQNVKIDPWADEWQYGPPIFEGGTIPGAIKWITELAEPFHLQVVDPFLTAPQRFLLNGHNNDFHYNDNHI